MLTTAPLAEAVRQDAPAVVPLTSDAGKEPMPNHNTKNRVVNPVEAKTFTVTLSRLANTPPPDVGRAHRAPPVVGVDCDL